MKVKDICKLIRDLQPGVDVSVAGVFGEDVNHVAWFYSTIYDAKPSDFENMATKDEEVLKVEIVRDEKLNVEAVYIYFDMNKKEDKMESDNKMGYFTITKSGMTLNKLLAVFKSEVFELHFSEHEPDDYICGDLVTGEVLQRILKDDVLNARVIEAHREVYGDDSAEILVTIDYNLDKEKINENNN